MKQILQMDVGFVYFFPSWKCQQNTSLKCIRDDKRELVIEKVDTLRYIPHQFRQLVHISNWLNTEIFSFIVKIKLSVELVKVYTNTDALSDYEPSRVCIFYCCLLFLMQILIHCFFVSPNAPHEDIQNSPGQGSEQPYLSWPWFRWPVGPPKIFSVLYYYTVL